MKITKTRLKQLIKEELQEMQEFDPSQELGAQGLSRDDTLYYEPEEEVTHEEVIEKVQELPQGALAQIWALLKDIGAHMAQNMADMPADTLGREDMGLEEKKTKK